MNVDTRKPAHILLETNYTDKKCTEVNYLKIENLIAIKTEGARGRSKAFFIDLSKP